MHTSQGRLRYSPKLLGDRKSEKWWLVVDCDDSIGQYHRHLYWVHTYRTHKLVRPAWKEHITVIRNEEPPDKRHWEQYDGEVVEFSYDFSAQTNGEYWWLRVDCPRLLEIREELGLSREPLIPLHLSIGHEGTSNVAP